MTAYFPTLSTERRSGIPPKRVVIVDDSATMRRWLRHVLESDARITIVGEASDAKEARNVIRAQKPDAITLDIEMPGMNGLEFLDRLMRLHPLPVVMVSSATKRGSDAAVQALSLGAVDCLLKPENIKDSGTQRDLIRRVFSAACSQVSMPERGQPGSLRIPTISPDGALPIVLIGASTGGVAALETLLRGLHAFGPPVVIVQHMPGSFLVSFSKMLNKKLPQTVGLLSDGDPIGRGQIMLAPATGRTHAGVSQRDGSWVGKLFTAGAHSLHCPSVDALFTSAEPYGPDVISVLLTGLGRDGAQGMKALRESGARTLGQDQASCVVYGMPRAAWELGAVEQQLPLQQLSAAINQHVLTYRSTRRDRPPVAN